MPKWILNSMRIFMVVIGIGLLSVFVLSCGDSDSDNDGDGDGNQTLTITGESGNQVDMNGTWGSGCVDDIDDGESDTIVITISGSSFTQVEKEWTDSLNCPGTPDINVTLVGTVALGDEVTVDKSGSDVTATELDGVFSSFKATLNSANIVDDFNADRTCGFDDWAVGITKELLGTDCKPDSDFKDVMYIDDTVDPDAWYSGDDDPLDANGYPTELESDSVKYRM